MEPTVADLGLREATVEDHDDILAITADEDLYGGLDYLPHVLLSWLQEGSCQTSNRRNLVFTLFGHIIGFRSLYFQNGGKVCARFGFRVTKFYRGQGFGKQMTILVRRYLHEKFPQVQFTLSVIPDNDMTDEQVNSPKQGSLVSVKSVLNYKICKEKSSPPLVLESPCFPITKTEFADLLRDNDATQHLLDNNLVHMNWVPVIPETEDDIEFATRKKQVVLVNGAFQTPSSLSVLTLPFSVPKGNRRTAIDIFTNDSEEVKLHIYQHMKRIWVGSTGGDIFLSIVVSENNVKAAHDAMVNLGLGSFTYIYGSQQREISKMYFYLKNL